MKSFSHRFERLPSEREFDPEGPIQPTTSYQGASENKHQTSSLSIPQFQYEPVRPIPSSRDQAEQTPWTASAWVKWLTFFSHLVLTLVPIAFIVLAFLALSVDGTPLSDRGQTVYEAAKLGPSVFPIVFAAVVGRLMKTFALWRAERGSTIGVLEQLNGSQNLLAALERSFLLGHLCGWSSLIVVLWALSPLGGQSSLRILELSQSGNDFKQKLYYMNTENFTDTIYDGASDLAYGLPAAQAIYQACLLAPSSITSGSTDLWGNVKVPLLQAESAYTGSTTQDWVDIEHTNITVYSSLTGVVMSGLRSDTTTSFAMETSYLNFTCSNAIEFGGVDPNANSTLIFQQFEDWLGNVLVHSNKSINAFASSSEEYAWTSFTVDTNFNFSQGGNRSSKPVNLIYASRNVELFGITAYNCSVGSSRVESMVGCNGTVCRVDKMRPSRQYTTPAISTPWNQDSSYVPVYNFLSEFPWMSGSVHDAEVSPADFYVAGNNTPYQPAGIQASNYSDVSGLQVAQRLGALINTAWQSGIAKTYIASPPPDPAIFASGNATTEPFLAREAVAVMQTTQTVYKANKLWVGFTATISLILFVCGVAGMAFRYMTTAPDILGYVSTMTRDNPFFNDQRVAGADTLDGLERARLIRDAVVQISDVRPWQGGQGHIALKSVAAGENFSRTRLKRGSRAPSPSATSM